MLHFDLESLIRSAGVLGVMLIVFAETGLLVGFFLPGDSLLFTAGFLAAQGYLNIWALTVGCFAAAVIGDAVGYSIGKSAGRKLYERAGSKFFNPDHLDKAERFFARHGGKAVVIARFMPIVRTFVPVVAGMGAMRSSRFLAFNIIGGLVWAVGVTLSGYAAGHHLPGIQHYMAPVIMAIIVISLLPTVVHVWQEHGNDLLAMVRARLGNRRARKAPRANNSTELGANKGCDRESGHPAKVQERRLVR